MQKTLVVAGLAIAAGASFAYANADESVSPVSTNLDTTNREVYRVERITPPSSSAGLTVIVKKPDPQPEAAKEPVATKPATGRKVSCTLTAYYLPLRGQKGYVSGSFAGDRRMNGDEWTADGTRVRKGIIAMDRHYKMGTRVDIPGYGIGEKHDHGGAIRDKRTGNMRIDVHMGEGDAGRIAAMKFGKRTTTCTILG